ncbi:MAG: LysM peptidoglycan-binding domain-containing protein [Clostridia bacterium]|nr:LysM peptidoglycan-binding domain-containing protein [Clostridia bacterium]
MKIHTVKKEETIYDIAREYCTASTKILENNGLFDGYATRQDSLPIGDELLILSPTRSYTVRSGDTLFDIAKRFGTRVNDLLKYNPALMGNDIIYPEEILSIKYAPKTNAICLVNGYLYNGWKEENLRAVLPHLSYVTVSAHKLKSGRLQSLFDAERAAKIARDSGKCVLLRLYIPKEEKLEFKGGPLLEFEREAVRLGCHGITLAAESRLNDRGILNGIFDLKKQLISDELSLFLETTSDLEPIYADIADGIVINSDPVAMTAESARAEEKKLRSIAEKCDFARIFTDISPFGYRYSAAGKTPLEINEARKIAKNRRAKIDYDSDTMLNSFSESEGGERIVFPSLKKIKAMLDLTCELGFLGVSIDIMRCATAHLMMISTEYISGCDYFPM